MQEKNNDNKIVYDENGDVVFTKECKKDYTLLAPSMLPIHFDLLGKMISSFGYNLVMLDNRDSRLADVGLKYVNNDACYPAILVIGELISAALSGKYDTHKLALVISQTGGGCRASNYIYLLKKALKKANLEYVPVLSFNIGGLKTQQGFTFTLSQYYKLAKCLFYGDLIMLLKNQTLPYEKNKGETDALVEYWLKKLGEEFLNNKYLKYSYMKKNYLKIIESFKKIGKIKIKKPKVGIVGEIFIKYSPLGNNNLEELLLGEGAEVYMPALLDFMLYCIYNNVIDYKLYGMNKFKAKLFMLAYKFLLNKEKDIASAIKTAGGFNAPTCFDETLKCREGYIGEGMKMGEGWFLTAEMVELIHSGVKNIICAQPFGCLPNHIAGKGMMKQLREKNPDANIVSIDYDASASRVNQENRIKLMLSSAKL